MAATASRKWGRLAAVKMIGDLGGHRLRYDKLAHQVDEPIDLFGGYANGSPVAKRGTPGCVFFPGFYSLPLALTSAARAIGVTEAEDTADFFGSRRFRGQVK